MFHPRRPPPAKPWLTSHWLTDHPLLKADQLRVSPQHIRSLARSVSAVQVEFYFRCRPQHIRNQALQPLTIFFHPIVDKGKGSTYLPVYNSPLFKGSNMDNFEFDSEMGGYLTLCDRCGTAKGVRSNYLCDPCDKVWNSDDGPRWDDHLEASDLIEDVEVPA